MRYRLFDDHLAALLDQATHHLEHLRVGSADAAAEADDVDESAPLVSLEKTYRR